jgi:hypothetical protein
VVESVIADVESVIADVESVIADVESVIASVVSVIAVVESVMASVDWVTDVVGACAGGVFVPPLSSPHAATPKAIAPASNMPATIFERRFIGTSPWVGGTRRRGSPGGDTGTR